MASSHQWAHIQAEWRRAAQTFEGQVRDCLLGAVCLDITDPWEGVSSCETYKAKARNGVRPSITLSEASDSLEDRRTRDRDLDLEGDVDRDLEGDWELGQLDQESRTHTNGPHRPPRSRAPRKSPLSVPPSFTFTTPANAANSPSTSLNPNLKPSPKPNPGKKGEVTYALNSVPHYLYPAPERSRSDRSLAASVAGSISVALSLSSADHGGTGGVGEMGNLGPKGGKSEEKMGEKMETSKGDRDGTNREPEGAAGGPNVSRPLPPLPKPDSVNGAKPPLDTLVVPTAKAAGTMIPKATATTNRGQNQYPIPRSIMRATRAHSTPPALFTAPTRSTLSTTPTTTPPTTPPSTAAATTTATTSATARLVCPPSPSDSLLQSPPSPSFLWDISNSPRGSPRSPRDYPSKPAGPSRGPHGSRRSHPVLSHSASVPHLEWTDPMPPPILQMNTSSSQPVLGYVSSPTSPTSPASPTSGTSRTSRTFAIKPDRTEYPRVSFSCLSPGLKAQTLDNSEDLSVGMQVEVEMEKEGQNTAKEKEKERKKRGINRLMPRGFAKVAA